MSTQDTGQRGRRTTRPTDGFPPMGGERNRGCGFMVLEKSRPARKCKMKHWRDGRCKLHHPDPPPQITRAMVKARPSRQAHRDMKARKRLAMWARLVAEGPADVRAAAGLLTRREADRMLSDHMAGILT